MCDTWFEAIGWLKRFYKSFGKGTLDGNQLLEVTEAWRLALGSRDLRATDLVDFEGVDRRWRSPSNQLLRDTANLTKSDQTVVSLDPSVGAVAKSTSTESANHPAGLPD